MSGTTGDVKLLAVNAATTWIKTAAWQARRLSQRGTYPKTVGLFENDLNLPTRQFVLSPEQVTSRRKA